MPGPRQRDFDLKRLQCPAIWGSGFQALDTCADARDKLCVAATPWTALVERLKVSWSLWENAQRGEASCLLMECYMRLLPDPVFHQNCELLRDYRRALRVVLDSTWAYMQAACVEDEKDADHLRTFIAAVEPIGQLDAKQRAAVFALRGRLATKRGEETRWFRTAMDLSPGEGEWRYLVGWVIQENRKCRGTPSKEEIDLLRDAYRLRKNPDTVLRLARTYTDCGRSKYAEARALVDEALRLYPAHPRVLTNVANILTRLEGMGPASLRRIRDLYQQALDVVGERAFIHMKLGSLCLSTGEQQQANWHFAAAMRLNPSACRQFAANSSMLLHHAS